MSDEEDGVFEDWAEQNEVNGLPQVILPSGPVTITECAMQLFGLIAPRKLLFMRGGAVVMLMTRDDGLLALDVLKPAGARSFIEKFARLGAWRTGKSGALVLKLANCPHDIAEALLHCGAGVALLPRVQGLINCPVMHEVDGKLLVTGVGYDEATRLLVTGGEKPPVVELEKAVKALLALFADFDFQSEGDKARAVASLISPALRVGGFLSGRVPADVAEADQSQAGKTYRQMVLAAIYNERLSLVTCKEGGVGSVDESLSQALVAGRPFIQFDNFRGRFASAHLEAFLTAQGSFPCRVPHRGEITVPPENYFIFLTSNGVDTTRDFANRSNIIRIRKRPADYPFKKFVEGDLLAHVREHQAFYLGCLQAAIGHWQGQGKPRTTETRHDFREWVQVVDWIAQHVFGTVPVMDGHQQAQERVSNPAMVWLRKVVLAASEAGELDRALTATDLHGLCDSGDISIPGLGPGSEEGKGKRVIGSVMAKLFKDGDKVEVEGFTVTRGVQYVAREPMSDGGGFASKTYTVSRV